MPDFHFSCPVEVRYGDLDPQGHVNNARFLTYLEHARIKYLIHIGLLSEEGSFLEPGFIIADAHVTFLAPVLFGMDVRVRTAITRLGNKSITMEYLMIENSSGAELARGSTVIVTYDYRDNASIPVPDAWRERIRSFENLTERSLERPVGDL